ncbi:hypothetical protein ACFX2I_015237 [Malus domestica]
MALLSHLSQLWQEQLQRSSIFSLLLVSILFLSIYILFSSLTKSSGKPLKLPPSPPKLPLIGNLHQLGAFPHRSLRALSKKYGSLMLFHFGKVPTLVVSSVEMAREVMKTHDTVFASRPQMTAPGILFYEGHDVAFAPYGDYWRKVRKICVLELLSLKRVQQFQYARVEEAAEMVEKIQTACLSESPIDLSELLILTSNNIMCRSILGQKFDDEDGSWFGETAKALMVQVMSFSFGDMFPASRWIDSLRGYIAHLKAIFSRFDKFYDQLIDEHKTADREGKTIKKDFVDILLQIQNDGALDFEFTKEDLKALLQDMFVGGSDTSSTAMVWLMAELVRNPRVMKKVQEEVRRVVGKKAKVEENDLSQMKYMKCVIKENLRLHPPAPLLIPRESTADIKLGGYDIPAKTRVMVSAFSIQRDPEVWDRPEEFIPERFEDSSIDFKGQDFQLIPFGAGRRGCPGIAFGVLSAEQVLASILYWFDWKVPSTSGSALPEALDMTEVYGLTVRKKAPLILVPVPYSP